MTKILKALKTFAFQQFAKDLSLLIGLKTLKLILKFISGHFILPVKLSL